MVNTEKYASQRGAVTDGHKSFNSNSIPLMLLQETRRERERVCVRVFFLNLFLS